MNQIDRTFHLRQFMNSPDGWGRAAGTAVSKKLASHIETANAGLVRISLDGIKRVDVTFASAALIDIIAENLGTRSICLIKAIDPDVAENIAAAAEGMKVPVTLWHGDVPQVIGRQPSYGLLPALTYALARSQVRTAEFARSTGLSAANASSKFKQLWEQGFLMRSEGTATSGGPEFIYRRIG